MADIFEDVRTRGSKKERPMLLCGTTAGELCVTWVRRGEGERRARLWERGVLGRGRGLQLWAVIIIFDFRRLRESHAQISAAILVWNSIKMSQK